MPAAPSQPRFERVRIETGGFEMATELVERRAFPDFGEMRHRVDQMLRGMGVGEGRGQGRAPSVDVVRREREIVLRADPPPEREERGAVEVKPTAKGS
jgi:hypothetical protein